MSLEGPRVVFMLKEDEPALARALRLAREVEEILDQASSAAVARDTARGEESAHSTRIVRAVAASLVDELAALVRGTRNGGVA